MIPGRLLLGTLLIVAVTLAGVARADAETRLYLAPGGLEIIDPEGSRLVAMNEASRAETMEIATLAWGAPASDYSMEECGYGDMQFAEFEGGVTLAFDGEAFIGWMTAPDAATRLANGVGAGSPVGDVEAIAGPVETFESSIGHEFAAGDLYGIADGPGTKGHIEMLWSGVSCIFR